MKQDMRGNSYKRYHPCIVARSNITEMTTMENSNDDNTKKDEGYTYFLMDKFIKLPLQAYVSICQ